MPQRRTKSKPEPCPDQFALILESLTRIADAIDWLDSRLDEIESALPEYVDLDSLDEPREGLGH
jgi:hypothetical protein